MSISSSSTHHQLVASLDPNWNFPFRQKLLPSGRELPRRKSNYLSGRGAISSTVTSLPNRPPWLSVGFEWGSASTRKSCSYIGIPFHSPSGLDIELRAFGTRHGAFRPVIIGVNSSPMFGSRRKSHLFLHVARRDALDRGSFISPVGWNEEITWQNHIPNEFRAIFPLSSFFFELDAKIPVKIVDDDELF